MSRRAAEEDRSDRWPCFMGSGNLARLGSRCRFGGATFVSFIITISFGIGLIDDDKADGPSRGCQVDRRSATEHARIYCIVSCQLRGRTGDEGRN